VTDAQFETRQRRAKTKPSAPDEPTPWSRDSVGLPDGHEVAYIDILAKRPSAPDEPTHRYCIASEQLCQWIFNGKVTWRAPDEPTPWKSIASVHPTLPFLVAFSQWLV
jgi:hypothetical protein